MEKGSSNVSGIETCNTQLTVEHFPASDPAEGSGDRPRGQSGHEIHYEICNDEIVPIFKAIFESKGAVFIEGGHDDD